MYIYFAIFESSMINKALLAVVFIFYVISGLRRLIQFNIDAQEGEVTKYFTGIPTPLGAILLFASYLAWTSGYVPEELILVFMILVAYMLNSKIKIPHP